MAFIVKLDMRLNDPCCPTPPHQGMRKLLLAQRSLLPILRALQRRSFKTHYDVIREWVKYKYVPAADEIQSCRRIFGIPIKDAGKLRWEYWGLKTPGQVGRRHLRALLRPEQLIMREAIRRGIRFQKHFLRCVLYGYVRPDTLESFAPREIGRRIESWDETEYEGWLRHRKVGELDDLMGGLNLSGGEGEEAADGEGKGKENKASSNDHQTHLDADEEDAEDAQKDPPPPPPPPPPLPGVLIKHDPLLDLGAPKAISIHCIDPRLRANTKAAERKSQQDEFLEACVQWCRDERQLEEDGMDVDLI